MLLAVGLIVIVGLGAVFALRMAGVQFPFIMSNVQPAPQGVAVTISLLAFCKDNSTEVIAVKEYKLSEMSLLTASGKEIKYFAFTATFLAGPPKGEILQVVDLTYNIVMKTSTGTLEPVKKTIRLPIVANLALHQSAIVPITAEQLGLTKIGDATLLTTNVNVEADMTTDGGHKVFMSSGNVETRLSYQEGGFLSPSGVRGQVSEEGAGTLVAVLTGTWKQHEWRGLTILGIVDPKTGITAYMLAHPGEDDVDVTGQNPGSGKTVDTTNVEPKPDDKKPGPTQTSSPNTVTIPDYDPHHGAPEYQPPSPTTTIIGATMAINEQFGFGATPTTYTITIDTGYEHEPPDSSVEAPSGGGYGNENEAFGWSWLPISWAPSFGLLNGYRMLLPIYIFGRTIDLAFVGAVLVSILLVILGAALSKKKR